MLSLFVRQLGACVSTRLYSFLLFFFVRMKLGKSATNLQDMARRVRAVLDANNRALNSDDAAGFGTHRALLLSAVAVTTGPVLEMGTGSFSTEVRRD